MSQQAPPPILCHTANVANVGSSAVLVTAGHCSHDEAIPGPMVTEMGTRFYHITQCGAGYRASALLTPNIFSASQCSLDWLQFVSYDIVNKNVL